MKDIITLDFETYYDKKFSLMKLTTEEYIRSPQFETIGVGVKVNNKDTEWASGTHEQLKKFLDYYNWDNAILVAHNTMFDGAILKWIYDIQPRVYADTLCMARALHGVDAGGSLKALAIRYNLNEKGGYVSDAISKHREDFNDLELALYGDYCVNDVEITYELFKILMKKFPAGELSVIDLTLRMFILPVLKINEAKLKKYITQVEDSKVALLDGSATSLDDLMSNDKFAEILKNLGVTPPTKISKTTGKKAHAFAKTDESFKALLDHEDERVQAVMNARLGVKSTLAETRANSLLEIGQRGDLPVPLKYYGAHTGRWSGFDKINLQNLPSRGEDSTTLKSAIEAPKGSILIDADSSQIEARTLAWIAGQTDLVKAFANGEDVYVKMAGSIYNKTEDLVTDDERFVGKATILGAGYGMGAARFKEQLKVFGRDINLEEAQYIIDVYRKTYPKIPKFWRECDKTILSMYNGESGYVGHKVRPITFSGREGLLLPSGLYIPYPELKNTVENNRNKFSYVSKRKQKNLWGGVITENVCQALSRIIIAHQMLLIAKKYRVLLTVHDSIITVVNRNDVFEAVDYIKKCMRDTPTWAEGLPLDCEVKIGFNYGKTKKV